MGANRIWLVPKDRMFFPNSVAIDSTEAFLLSARPDWEEPKFHISSKPKFFDNGITHVSCTSCGRIEDIYECAESDKWWDKLSEAFAYWQNPGNVHVTMYCCGASVRASDLRLIDSQGRNRAIFTRLLIELQAVDDESADPLPDDVLKTCQHSLGGLVEQLRRGYT